MRAMRAEKFSGYDGLKPVDPPKPAVSDGKVLLRMSAVGDDNSYITGTELFVDGGFAQV